MFPELGYELFAFIISDLVTGRLSETFWEQGKNALSPPSEGWAQHFVAPLASEIHFVPAFFVDLGQLSASDGQGNGGFGGVTNGDSNLLNASTQSPVVSSPSLPSGLVPSNSIAGLASAFRFPGDIVPLVPLSGTFLGHLQVLIRFGVNVPPPARKTYMVADALSVVTNRGH
ncbi:hypothetical protein JB92DRAFT_2824940 [Gautieria morchelliformis]|nr:hypothetical protein JB92DRAFT_2824940 [Gautieria morchelliformis]